MDAIKNKNTKLCGYVESIFDGGECENKADCTFAHSFDEFKPKECIRSCSHTLCCYYHPFAETKGQYLLRGGRTHTKRPTILEEHFLAREELSRQKIMNDEELAMLSFRKNDTTVTIEFSNKLNCREAMFLQKSLTKLGIEVSFSFV